MTDTASHASQVDAVFARAPVIPVLTIERIEDAIPLARALSDNGLPVLEVTLRSACAVDAIALIARELADACVGAGTVLNARDLDAVAQAGARFAISPGATDSLYRAAAECPVPLIPGIATASELMRGLEHGWQRFKFFPAESSGGIGALKGFAGPFAQVRFCPTGGIDAAKAPAYLGLPNVACVGGSWMLPADALAARDWARIGGLARAAAALTR
ncbi:bifunctional 4-hydroxy-2-oxoglutarate aldolase/2-dehydro-3-deoxy-phosphogluconate aldolase [Thermomonas sp.]|uniref:bifunctional 4-hydroxy-2-oxoglutarate aldolase/2-dehydro-3-deoxy-phosphogluconate aldolase n=2 Tax=Thermomonas sp. TaxID=1971895 RepID=UPI001B41940E|nr:bifunctional 4-hydroxy-2-oxoglutarate aldolase/2-dehydro-3-deoxy-phosphogluconate aldolase [Thermomonas sp.]MBK6924310.1 bifunctional 4-hydroxy-2-oxoglutarate aldolase/2-dehydro-3-deoxy-phosphogluconate aldolase [Thermomonas sp.]MBK9668436.1 bifunctional 4-hydroxy-2-oxoglutarate aldolase/2-dehydro-3-deoxy-phosphogluconate aldolase [Thermomonas sp.]MBL0227070.1 bifunctional 4-hydroxy-2-oxoglutarate aldolase/2-dehydro-3-deoxy-phosphogluconate aldolase [Thermomonas sp.]MBP6438226.1 bifunctional